MIKTTDQVILYIWFSKLLRVIRICFYSDLLNDSYCPKNQHRKNVHLLLNNTIPDAKSRTVPKDTKIPLPQKSALQSEDSDWRFDIPSKADVTAVGYKCELAVRPLESSCADWYKALSIRKYHWFWR